MSRRAVAILTSIAVGVGGLTALSGPAFAADPAVVPSATTIPVGGSFTVSTPGCSGVTEGGKGFRTPEVTLLTGVGDDVQRAAVSFRPRALTIPGWVDPDQPARLVGRCVEVSVASTQFVSTLFSYAPVSIDIVAGDSPAPTPVLATGKSAAAGGTVLPVQVSGCFPGGEAVVMLLAGREPSAGDPFGPIASVQLAEGASGTASGDLPLLTTELLAPETEGVDLSGRPVPAGNYSVQVLCLPPSVDVADPFDEQATPFLSKPVPLVVAATSPSTSIRARHGAGTVTIAGDGCTGGRTVRARIEVSSEWTGEDGPETVEASPVGSGSWSIEHPVPTGSFLLSATVDCGDPTETGFRYSALTVRERRTDLFVERASPESSPTGGAVRVLVRGDCPEGAAVGFATLTGETRSSASVEFTDSGGSGVGTLSAPDEAGTYRLRSTCGDLEGGGRTYEVFAPTVLSGVGPLPTESTDGWPVMGATETYRGRVGPIVLNAPGEGPPPNAGSGPGPGTFAPQGLLSELARPEGDVAITGMRLRVVDEAGNPVSSGEAMLDYFVIGDLSSANPACPDGTFGLPGDIVAAAGGEVSTVELPAPYGIVAPADAPWGASYSIENRTGRGQRLYLAYDLDIRRDVENVRPVQRYFGSARGCANQSWNLDGSGAPDTQSAYVTMRADGRLVGAGAYLKPGALAAEVVNDRGRRNCRSVPQTDGRVLGADQAAGDDIGWDGPPSLYPDDQRILAMGFCNMAESVKAGERLRLDATYANDRARSGVMGIFQLYVWEGGGPSGPGPDSVQPAAAQPAAARPGRPTYAG